MSRVFFDEFVKGPSAALRCILRHCGVSKKVRLIPQDLRALQMAPLRIRPLSKLLRGCFLLLTQMFSVCYDTVNLFLSYPVKWLFLAFKI